MLVVPQAHTMSTLSPATESALALPVTGNVPGPSLRSPGSMTWLLCGVETFVEVIAAVAGAARVSAAATVSAATSAGGTGRDVRRMAFLASNGCCRDLPGRTFLHAGAASRQVCGRRPHRPGKWRSPAGAGLLGSRPVSRILSLSSHPSERPTWTSASSLRTVLLGLASGGVCLAAVSPRRRCALTAPFHPCLCAVGGDPLACAIGGVFSVALSRGFPRVG